MSETRYFFKNPLGESKFTLLDFVGQEKISSLFHYDLNLASDDPDIVLGDLINQVGTIEMERHDEIYHISGIISNVEIGHRTGDYYLYKATIVPTLWRASLSYQNRVYQNETVDMIVCQILEEHGVAYEPWLSGSYNPEEFCVQYKESDLNFIQRLLEYYGIHYFFVHGDGSNKLILSDDSTANPTITGQSSAQYNPSRGMVSTEGTTEHVNSFVAKERVVTGKVIIKDYNYRTPETTIKEESNIDSNMPGVFYDYGIHAKDSSEASNLARIRNEELNAQRQVMHGDSDISGMHVGQLFTLEEHYRGSLNQDYLITELTVYGSQHHRVNIGGGGGGGQDYHNTFSVIPSSVPFRPQRVTPEPKMPGILTAKVESTGGQYPHIDDQGRYRVRFPFDIGDSSNAQGSKTVRMAQPHSGEGYGFHFPLHENQEMVIGFKDGNFNRPIGLGAVPNHTNTSPVTSGNNYQNAMMTRAGNYIILNDEEGHNHIINYTPGCETTFRMGIEPNEVTRQGKEQSFPDNGILGETDCNFNMIAKNSVFVTTEGHAEYTSQKNAYLLSRTADTKIYGNQNVLVQAENAAMTQKAKTNIGITAETDGIGIDAAKGINIKGGGGVTVTTNDVNTAALGGTLAAVDSAVGIMGIATGIKGATGSTVGTKIATALGVAGSVAGVVGNVLGATIVPGYTMATGGGMTMVSALPGFIGAATGLSLTSGTGLSGYSLAGISFGTITGGIGLAAASGGISLGAVQGDMGIETKLGNIDIKTLGGNATIDAMFGVELKCGISKIKMTPASIKMSVGPNELEISPASFKAKGIQLSLEAVAMAKMSGPMASVEAQALAKVKGSINMVG